MGGRFLNAALIGLGCGLAFGFFGFWESPTITGIAMAAGLVIGLTVEGLGGLAEKSGGTPADYSRMGLIGFACAAATSAGLGLSLFKEAGPMGMIVPAFFLLPTFALAWGPRWYRGNDSAFIIRKLGNEHIFRNLVGTGAALGFVAGLLTKSPVFGVFFLMLLGAVVGAIVWMDADESLRRQES